MVPWPVVHLILVTVSALLLAFVPGALLLGAFTNLREKELLASSPGVTFLIFGASVFFGNVIGANQAALSLALLAALVPLLIPVWIYRRPAFTLKRGAMPGLFLLFFLHLLAFQCLLPVYAGGMWYGDWWEHYSIAQVYLHHGDYGTIWFGHFNLLTRTPLFNLVASFFLSLFGDNFWVFQVAASLMNSMFILPLYVLTERLFGEKTGKVAVAFLLFNTWVLHNAWYTWPKLLNVYFVLLSVHYYLEFKGSRRGLYLFTLFCALAFMSHQLAALYMLGFALDYLRGRPSGREGLEALIKFSAVFLTVVAPWYLWAASIFSTEKVVLSVPTAIAMAGYRSFLGLLKVFLNNAVKSILPISMLKGPSQFNLVDFYYNPILGAVTMTVGLYVLYLLWRGGAYKKAKSALETGSEHSTMLLLVAAGYLGALLVQLEVSENGIAHNSMVPLVLILSIYAARLLELAGRWIALLFAGIVSEFGVSTWYQVHRLTAGAGLDKIAENNLALKGAAGLVFLRDYVGGFWVLAALCALALELAALYMLYLCNIKNARTSSRSGLPQG